MIIMDFKKISTFMSEISDKDKRFLALAKMNGYFPEMSDEEYLCKKYLARMGKPLDLDNPQTFTEKLQWLKIYDRNPLYTTYVDKYEVKRAVADIIGDDHVLPALGVWDSVEQIDFDSLPQQFVLKCTHNSGGFVICTDKTSFDIKNAKEKLRKWLSKNYYYGSREWPYKNVKPRILAEPYISTLGKPNSIEYKLTCCNGIVKNITVCTGIAHVEFSKRHNDNYDRNLNHLSWWAYYENSGMDFTFPEQIDQIIEFAERLSAGIPQVRVDFYLHDGVVYFGEMTFFTWGGFIEFNPPEQDLIMGEWIKLPQKDK